MDNNNSNREDVTGTVLIAVGLAVFLNNCYEEKIIEELYKNISICNSQTKIAFNFFLLFNEELFKTKIQKSLIKCLLQ